MKPAAREAFRWFPHTSGHAVVKPKDYEAGEEIDASSEYAAWKLLNEGATPLFPGDLLELITEPDVDRSLKIVKYIGFEPASWWVSEHNSVGNRHNKSDSAPNAAEI
jgi:hypothetical protein